jgi:hypothetical protein
LDPEAFVRFDFEAELWLYPGDVGWVFASLPPDVADEVLDVAPRIGGFGSVGVEVTIGDTTWRTSLFPDSKRATYLLPVKQAVRRAEGLALGDTVRVTVTPVMPPPRRRTRPDEGPS